MAYIFSTAANSAAGPGAGNATWSEPIDRAQVLRRLELLARFLDDAIELPGLKYRIGWDGIIGLIPGVGDAFTTLTSGYLIWEAHRLGVSQVTMAKMIVNVLIDMLAGSIPIVGDLFDLTWKANRRNLKLLHEALSNAPKTAPETLTLPPARGI